MRVKSASPGLLQKASKTHLKLCVLTLKGNMKI